MNVPEESHLMAQYGQDEMKIIVTDDPTILTSYSSRNTLHWYSWRTILCFTCLQATILILFISAFLNARRVQEGTNKCRPTPDIDIIPSPARDAVQYEIRYYEKYGYLTSPFSQPPSPFVDRAWHDLLESMNIRVSEIYLKPFNATSVPLKDGSGYVVQLGVYHELHCLKKIRHWMHRSYYYPSLEIEDLGEEEAHAEHCLEWLRTAALCRGDITLTTMAWSKDVPRRLETEYPIPRRCVKTESLFDWAHERRVDLSEDL